MLAGFEHRWRRLRRLALTPTLRARRGMDAFLALNLCSHFRGRGSCCFRGGRGGFWRGRRFAVAAAIWRLAGRGKLHDRDLSPGLDRLTLLGQDLLEDTGHR